MKVLVPNAVNEETPLNLIRAEEVAKKMSCSKATLYRVIREDPDFPKPIKFNSRWVAYFECEIDAYLIKKAAKQHCLTLEEVLAKLNRTNGVLFQAEAVAGISNR